MFKKSLRITCFLFVLWIIGPHARCVKSNLDNAFDPTSLPGLFIGIVLSTSSSGDGSSVDPNASVCSDLTPTLVEFATIGTTTYTVPADTRYVFIRAIGGGGAGGYWNAATCGANSEVSTSGTASMVKIQGAPSNLLEATGGTYGTCGYAGTAGTGGAGGSPAGVTGTDGNLTVGYEAPGGEVAPHWGAGHKGSVLALGSGSGGGGGSGGLNTGTFSDLAGETLEITTGDAGKVTGGGWDGQLDGNQGIVQLTLF